MSKKKLKKLRKQVLEADAKYPDKKSIRKALKSGELNYEKMQGIARLRDYLGL